MRTYFDCIPCFVRQALDSVRLFTDDERIHEEVLRQVLRETSKMDLQDCPPIMGHKIHSLIRKLTGMEDPYLDIKNRFNKLALQMYVELEERIDNSSKPFETAVRLAMASNVIDFGVKAKLEYAEVEKTITESLSAPLDKNLLDQLSKEIEPAKRILYIGDNAGEIVFDMLLIKKLPTHKITFVVKASPFINDATIEDAQICGLTDIVEVIDNGSDAPGTILSECSKDFQRRFSNSDLIIAKGQANYETLSDIDKDIYFMLKAKCPVIARDIGCEVGNFVLIKNDRFRNSVSNANSKICMEDN